MRRREFITGLGSATVWPILARAQQRSPPTVGWLHSGRQETQQDFYPAFLKGLSEIGFVDGRNVTIEHRWAEYDAGARPALVAEIVRRQVAVIVVDTTNFAQETKAATQTIPIVFMAGGDPVEFGLVESFNHPGGNVTGIAILGASLTGKRLELVSTLVPGSEPIALLLGSRYAPYAEAETRDLRTAARALGVQVLVLNVADESEIEPAFASLSKQRVRALLISSNILFQIARLEIISLASRQAIPTMFFDGASAVAGALSSYGPNFSSVYYQAGIYAGRILKGDKPANLPVIQPTKFELVINLKTAKALGLTIPETLLATADEVIQ
jgi:putative ABC transport system substrate-binding protein